MKAALYSNTCPFCGSDVMEAKKAKQYSSLVTVLGDAKFTNREDIDEKVKEKVISLLVDNFEFTRLAKTKPKTEVIAVEDDEDSVETEDFENELEDLSSKEEAPRAPRSLAKVKTRRPTSSAPRDIYHQAQADMYEVDDGSYDDYDDVSPEERAELERYFQDTTPAEIREKVEARLAAAKQITNPSSGGIKRLR